MIAKEYLSWCEIFNEYKVKLELFYIHSKIYVQIYKDIYSELEEIRIVFNEYINYRKLNFQINNICQHS
jgi:hypothetical protein